MSITHRAEAVKVFAFFNNRIHSLTGKSTHAMIFLAGRILQAVCSLALQKPREVVRMSDFELLTIVFTVMALLISVFALNNRQK